MKIRRSESLYERALRLFADGEYARAASMIDDLLSSRPRNRAALTFGTQLALILDDPAKASRLLEVRLACAKFPLDGLASKVAILVHTKADATPELAQLEAAVDARPDDINTRIERAIAARIVGNHERVLEDADLILGNSRRSASQATRAYALRYGALTALGREAEARACMRALLRSGRRAS